MTDGIQVSRRGFLAGLAGMMVIARLPAMPVAASATAAPANRVAGFIGFADITQNPVPPPGWVYNWKRSSLMGVPEPEYLQSCIDQGWQFVTPDEQPQLEPVDAACAVEACGLVLMKLPIEKANELHEAQRQRSLAQLGGLSPPGR